jgi:putative addiction module component (TIGR02574 family)
MLARDVLIKLVRLIGLRKQERVMPHTPVDDIEAQAMALTPEQRSELIERLLAKEDAFALSPEWEEEIKRRVEELEAGRTEFIPAEEAMARLAEHIQSRLQEK